METLSSTVNKAFEQNFSERCDGTFISAVSSQGGDLALRFVSPLTLDLTGLCPCT